MRVLPRRHAIALAITLLALAVATIPSTRAQAAAATNWFGWGVKIRFANGMPKVSYATYIGTNTPSPTVQQAGLRDISASCTTVGTVTYPNTTTARFNGSSYVRCALPSGRDELLKLGYTPPSGDTSFISCPVGGGPFWADASINGMRVITGTYPLFDLSDLGVRMNLQISGGSARTQLQAASRLQAPGTFASYNSPYWAINSTSNHVVMGWYGSAIVPVADNFAWFDYMSSPNWRTFYNGVGGTNLGSWYEAPVTTQQISTTGKYEVGLSRGTLYIGYSPATGTYYTGNISAGGVEPGCKG
jgi:hypothetical protein